MSPGSNERVLRAEPLEPAEHELWDRFAMSSGGGAVFHTSWWYRGWGTSPTIHVLRDANGDIQGGICYALARRLGSRVIARPPLTAQNGPLFAPCRESGRHRQNTENKRTVLSLIHGLPRLGGYDFVLRPCDTDVMPFLWNGFDTLVGYTYFIPQTERETWLQHASKTQRWSVRRAAREAAEKGFGFVDKPPLGEILQLLKETATFKGYRFSTVEQRTTIWWQMVEEHGAGRAYLLRDSHGHPACGALLLYDGRTAYYAAGGIRNDLRKGSLVNVLMIHRMIEDAHAMGLDFDFEGSILPGVEGFFRSLGGELRPVFRVVKFPSPLLCVGWQVYRYFTRHGRREWVWYE